MAWEHRTEERKKKLESLRELITRACELVVAGEDGLTKVSLWGGPQSGDFSNDTAIDAARLTETIIGIAAANQLFAALGQPVAGYESVTVLAALQRISSP